MIFNTFKPYDRIQNEYIEVQLRIPRRILEEVIKDAIEHP